jgi:hypothetical protein
MNGVRSRCLDTTICWRRNRSALKATELRRVCRLDFDTGPRSRRGPGAPRRQSGVRGAAATIAFVSPVASGRAIALATGRSLRRTVAVQRRTIDSVHGRHADALSRMPAGLARLLFANRHAAMAPAGGTAHPGTVSRWS